jgi:uncharacterized protein (DUF305 family)
LKKFPSKAWLFTLLLAVAFILAACGGVGSGQQGDQSGGHSKMDHGQMGHGSVEQMRSMGMMMNPQHLAQSEPFDKAFIDAMIPHHQSAIYMAQVAHEKSKIAAIKELAENIMSALQREIEHTKQWRKVWYPEG